MSPSSTEVANPEEPIPSAPRTRRRTLLLAGVPLALVALATGIVFAVQQDEPPTTLVDRPAGPVNAWVSGASGEGVVDGEFGDWRGAPLQIAGTWADEDPDLQTALPQLHRGEEFGSWQESLDIAIGAIGEGETWAEAAEGDYDGRWRSSLRTMARLWEDRPGTLYIRFAHEMNGDWYPWKVTADNHEDFITAWLRFRALQQELFPESKLVFGLNRESIGSDIDWRETFPGAEYVDVIGVDYYNQNPSAATQEEFDRHATETDEWGAPKGIRGFLDFAREQGLPLAIPEWNGNNEEGGDSPAFIAAMYDLFAEEGGSGPGEILYEIIFNVAGYDGAYQLYPDTAMPHSAEQYENLW